MAESPDRASDTGGSWWSRLGLGGSPQMQKDGPAIRSPGAPQTLATDIPNAAVKTPLKQIRTPHSTSHPGNSIHISPPAPPPSPAPLF